MHNKALYDSPQPEWEGEVKSKEELVQIARDAIGKLFPSFDLDSMQPAFADMGGSQYDVSWHTSIGDIQTRNFIGVFIRPDGEILSMQTSYNGDFVYDPSKVTVEEAEAAEIAKQYLREEGYGQFNVYTMGTARFMVSLYNKDVLSWEMDIYNENGDGGHKIVEVNAYDGSVITPADAA